MGSETLDVRSAAGTVGQALAEAGLPLQGLDYSQPAASAPLPSDGQVRIVHVVETVALAEKSIPFNVRTELSADLELDQQSLLQGGQVGLAVTRTRVRSEDGVTVSTQSEGETVVRTPEDRVLGYGTKIVIRTATVDGQTITYWRALRLYATSYSPCQSAGIPGKCYYGTSSGLPVKRGVVAMVYYWYLLFGGQPLYIPGYGYATVGDVGANPSNHYWIDLGWTDADYQPMEGWMTVYFLVPVQEPNPGYILP
jgi:3D (Asp-Asp-Asp) domain-containing protein